MEMNEAQKQAVAHKDGPMMVLAGPGAGEKVPIILRV